MDRDRAVYQTSQDMLEFTLSPVSETQSPHRVAFPLSFRTDRWSVALSLARRYLKL